MQFPVIFLSFVAAVSAAPQLFFVVPPAFLESKTMQELNSLIPVVVPFGHDQAVAAYAKQETVQGSEPAPEVAAVAPEAPAVAEEAAEESLPTAPVQEEAAQEEAVPQSETEIATDAPVETEPEVPVEETTEPQPSVADEVEEVVTEAVPQQQEIILPARESADTPTEVMTNEIVAPEVVESSKPEETLKTDPSSGKSINSAVHAVPSTTLITHFGFSNPNAIIRSSPNTITHQGTVVDPRSLIPVEYRHFIYENDSPEVVAAKVAFFRVQAALTPRKKL